MRFNRKTYAGVVEGDMTPMIDMTFQLIAFFMVLINFSDTEQDQRVNLPSSELAKPPETAYVEPITIQMTADETILFGSRELGSGEAGIEELAVDLKREARLLRAYGKVGLAEVTVVIRADHNARTGRVQEIIQACQEADFETFALRGRQSDVTTLYE
ncbi:Biopolymer transport protein ExbD/TolR [Pseudobythopirellula maris]|uniref:Biopolymer transport protein ExbD/TolR n=1 Tax=Pseudobythopirellula maris TaxID=2527991 RepID=A0A5C5ZK79_9BACT|nr:biopolymer transporter ExbD [Pseudobythopirellula maris]TWT86823.1 Biopolymer transport protein ExbD/TolR [Pseudobythopirellula maris]